MAEANAKETQILSQESADESGKKMKEGTTWSSVIQGLTLLLTPKKVEANAKGSQIQAQESGGVASKKSQKETVKQSSSVQVVAAKKSSDAYFFLGIFTVVSLLLLAPNFMFNLLDGRFDLRILVHDLSVRMQQLQGLMAKAPLPIRLRNAIISQESDGNHQLLNGSGSGAMGLGQIMPENLPSWSMEAVGREVSTSEFLSNPDLQLQIIDFKLNQYWQTALSQARGNEEEAVLRVAAWWYSGDPDKFADPTPQYWNGDAYPSIAEYANQVLKRYLQQ